MAPVAKAANQPVEKRPRKKPKKKIKKRKLCLKTCWLKTPEDWARFNAWAAKNAQPRKIPEIEPVARQSKPLSILKKRLRVLSRPSARETPPQCMTRTVSRAALRAKPSKRLKQIALPVVKPEPESCRTWTVSRAAMRYRPTENMIILSRPVVRPDPADCRDDALVSRAALKRKPSERDIELSRPKRFKGDEEEGTRRKKEEPGEMSEWMEFLAIPSYRIIKDQKTEIAQKYRERFLSELETRSKRAYEEQMRKRAEAERRRREEERRKREEEERKRREEKEEEEEQLKTSLPEESEVGGEEQQQQQQDEQEDEQTEDESGEGKEEKEEKKKEETQPRQVRKRFSPPVFKEDPERRAQRKKEKEAWRFTEHGCADFPVKVSKSALNYQATDNIAKMAKPKKHESIECKDPFKVDDKAKRAVATPRTKELAQPKHPPDKQYGRPPPYEYDEFGQPIIPKPEYGKKLPPVKPYEDTRPCPEKKDEEQEKREKEEAKKKQQPVLDEEEEEERKKRIDRIVNGPTIDPMFDPVGADRQMKLRKRAAEEADKEKERLRNEGDGAGAVETDAVDDDGAEENTEKNDETEET